MCTAFFVAIASWYSASAEERHVPTDALAPYEDGPPDIGLSATDLADLASGETLIRRVRINEDDRAFAVVRVNASPTAVWSVLLDFDVYPQWVDGLESSKIYERDGSDIYVTFGYQHWLVGEVTYHVRHTYPGETAGWGTWTLDYRRRSDLDDTVGFWWVSAVTDDPDSADVAYSTRIRLGGWLERWFGDLLIEDTLRAVTGGLRSRVEEMNAASNR